jgi:hypothetical protein
MNFVCMFLYVSSMDPERDIFRYAVHLVRLATHVIRPVCIRWRLCHIVQRK